MRSLRVLAPVRVANLRQIDANQRLRRAAFAIGLIAVILEFTLSPDTLTSLVTAYASPLIQLHPATFVLLVAFLVLLVLTRPAGAGLFRLFHDKPALALLNLLFVFCVLYSISNVGLSGAATHAETYLSAALLAVALESGTETAKRGLAWLILGLCGLSIMISIGGGVIQAASSQELTLDELHGAGLFSDPSTAALVTSMAMFMLLRMRMNALLKTMLFATFLIGLVSFGGGAALTTTLILVLFAASLVLLRGLVMRTLSLSVVGAIGAAIVVLPPLILMLGIDSGDPIPAHIAADDGAWTATLQWRLLNHLDLHDILFGASPARLDILLSQVNLGQGPTGIDNVWLQTFLDLGAICSIVLLFALGLFLVHLGRSTAHPLGWLLLLATILIDAAGDPGGPRTVDLFFMTACMIAMNGYVRTILPIPQPSRALHRLRQPAEGRMVERLGSGRPVHANLAGQQS